MPVLKTKPPEITLPPCGGCDDCGDHREDRLYLFGYKDKYYCSECFFEVAQKWPKPGGSMPRRPFRIPRKLVDHYMEKVFGKCREANKTMNLVGKVTWKDSEIDMVIGHAVAHVMTRSEQDTDYRKGKTDGDIDGTFPDGATIDVKCSMVEPETWDKYRYANKPTSPDGRVKADYIVAAKATRDLGRIEVVGVAKRDAKMTQVPPPGFKANAYVIADMEDPWVLYNKYWGVVDADRRREDEDVRYGSDEGQ